MIQNKFLPMELLEGCPSLLTIAVINTTTKGNLGTKGIIWLTLPSTNPSLKEVRAVTQERTQQRHHRTAYWFASLAYSGAFVTQPRSSWLGMALATGPFHSKQKLRKCLRFSFSVDVPSCHMALVCFKLTNMNQNK